MDAQPPHPADRYAGQGGFERGRRSRPARAGLPPPFHRPPGSGGSPSLPRIAARRGGRRARNPHRNGPIPIASRDARSARGPRGRCPASDAGGCPVSTDRDVTRIVRSWLEEGVTALPDRVLDTVLDQLPATPQRRAPWPVRRLLDMHIPARLAVAAAVVALVAVVGAID